MFFASMFIHLDSPFCRLLSGLLLMLRLVGAFPWTDDWYGEEGDGVLFNRRVIFSYKFCM
jgi:hypothetical protein